MRPSPQPYREPLAVTLRRTLAIAVVGGAALGGLRRWPIAAVLVLWVSLGGHCIELWFLNWLGPRLPAVQGARVAARLVVWFAGGVALGGAMSATARLASGALTWPRWWIPGVAFVGLELLVHLVLWMRGRPSFYDGHG
jgi:hypothetical protein